MRVRSFLVLSLYVLALSAASPALAAEPGTPMIGVHVILVRFSAFNPGVELTLEAFPDYWRKAPPVKKSLAMDRKAITDVEMLGLGRATGSLMPPEFELKVDPPAYDPNRAKEAER